jgi:hypothetical protein
MSCYRFSMNTRHAKPGPRPKPVEQLATRRGVSLSPEDDAIAQELARRYHGDNISRLIRHLLRAAWAAEPQEAVA